MMTSFDDFKTQFAAGKSQLVYQWIEGDLETPVSAYLKITGGQDYSFLLESVEGGEKVSRYSILGGFPDLLWKYQNRTVSVDQGDGYVDTGEDALSSLRAHIAACAVDHVPAGLPPMAASGLFGFLGYETVHLFEDVPQDNPDAVGIPDAELMRPQLLAIFDNVKHQICLVSPVYEHSGNSDSSAEDCFEHARDFIDDALLALKAPLEYEALNESSTLALPLQPQSNMEAQDYKDSVTKAIDYIGQGEIFQVVLAQRFETDFDLPPFALYRSLRRINPSPFLFHVQLDGYALVGSSPEILVRVRDDIVTIRPIAGTRKRGADKAEDDALEQDLLADEKECAEHLMLLDLGRNDVGRVSEYGSVEVTDRFTVERYSHVMHIVSNVEGKLRTDCDALDAFYSGFPAGTVSGAPKIRAMEIIDELETTQRKSYAGSVGYFSGHGDIDTCIALRTGLVKDGKLYVQAGAGVVADSQPESEHQECINKARAVFTAAELAIKESKQRDNH